MLFIKCNDPLMVIPRYVFQTTRDSRSPKRDQLDLSSVSVSKIDCDQSTVALAKTGRNRIEPYFLLDCNNFYVSCERVFNPILRNKSMVVLSSGDACIIA